MLFIIAPLLTITLITACGSDDDGPVTPPPSSDLNLVELAQSDDDFSILVDVIVDLGLVETLESGDYTVFAPTNAAFNALPEGVLESLTEEQLLDIVTFHVTEGSVPSTALQAQQDVEMLNEENTLVQSSAAGVIVNGSSNVVKADLEATNGYIHGIDEVLLPRDIRIALEIPNLVDVAEEAGAFTTLIDLVESVGLTTTLQYLGPYTAFAPTDEAFEALFAEVDPGSLTEEQITFILTYHVIAGPGIASGDLAPEQAVESANEELLYITSDEENGVVVNGNSTVVDADVEASNGIIHVVDNVLLPNAFLNTVQVAQKNYNFTQLVELIVQADLVEAVASQEFTVFAPTNDAFADLFAEVDPGSLTAEQVEEILLYHTIPGETIASGDLQAQQAVPSTTDENLYITVNGDVVVNGNSTVVAADVASSNGIIHAVDTVLLPNAFVDITAIAQKNYDLTSLVGLLVDFDLVTTLQGDGPFTVFAPTNAAFDAISDVVGGLTNDQIVEVLTYHVLAANVESGDIMPPQTVEMLNEQDITINVDNGTVTITDAAGGTAEVVVADQVGTNGVVHIIDAVLIPELGDGNGGVDGELITNGDFESGRAPWTEGAGEIREEGGNSFFFADVLTAGNPWDVNLSQVVEIVEGENYILEFDASTGAGNTRTMIAGIGQNEAPFDANVKTVNLTDQTQRFTLELTADFGTANSRVLFDMGAETGVVVIDNVSLVQGGEGSSNGNGGDIAEPNAAAPTPPARDAEDVISIYSDSYSNIDVTSFATEWSQGSLVGEVEIADGDNVLLYDIGNFIGIQLDSAIDLTEFTHMSFDYWVADESVGAGAVLNPKLSNHGNLPEQDGETSAIGSVNPVDTVGEWVSFDVALDDFTAESASGELDRESIYQILFTTAGTIRYVYIDNIYFYNE